MSDDPNIIALISRSLAQTARSRLLSWAGRFGLVASTTLSPSVRRGYALRARWGYLAHASLDASPPQTAAAAGAAVAWMATGSVAAVTAVVARVAMSDGMAGGGNSGAARGRGKMAGRVSLWLSTVSEASETSRLAQQLCRCETE